MSGEGEGISERTTPFLTPCPMRVKNIFHAPTYSFRARSRTQRRRHDRIYQTSH